MTIRGRFYRVEVCPECQAIWGYKNRSPNGEKMVWYRTGNWSLGICQSCGNEKNQSKETTACWVNQRVWYLPWTWLKGHWVLRDQLPPEDLARLINQRR